MTDTESHPKKLNRKRLLEFCAMHPDDPVFRFRLAESYQETGNQILSIYSARRAHALFTAENNSIQTRGILKQFGKEADSRKKHRVSDSFIRLNKELNVLSRRMKQVKLKEGAVLFQKGDTVDYLYLVVEGELAVVNKLEDKHTLLLQLGRGSVAFEYDVTPVESSVVDEKKEEPEEYDEYDEYDEDSGEQQSFKTVMYRGVKTTVVDDAPKSKKKPLMYRGSVVTDPNGLPSTNQESKTQVKHGTYRGNQVNKERYEKLRYATVVAQKDCSLLKFMPHEIEKELQGYALHDLFKKEAFTRFKLAKIANSKLFINLPISLRFLLAELTELSIYDHGDELKKAGEFMPCVKLIVQGHVQLYQKETDGSLSYCGRIKEGEMLGLNALFSDQPSQFIYQADHGCETIDIAYNILKDISALSDKFKSIIRAYHAETTTKNLRSSTLLQDDE